jgi:hypothetical protein
MPPRKVGQGLTAAGEEHASAFLNSLPKTLADDESMQSGRAYLFPTWSKVRWGTRLPQITRGCMVNILLALCVGEGEGPERIEKERDLERFSLPHLRLR